jgi:hypothetical protein
MPSYLVTWRIDIAADTAEQAALAAVAIQRQPDSTAVLFEVTDKSSGTATRVDLEPDNDCGLCNCRGWDIYNADLAIGELGEIQRCDDCRTLRGDLAACQAARAAGFTVNDDCQVIAYPPGFSIDAWRRGCWPERGSGAAPADRFAQRPPAPSQW